MHCSISRQTLHITASSETDTCLDRNLWLFVRLCNKVVPPIAPVFSKEFKRVLRTFRAVSALHRVHRAVQVASPADSLGVGWSHRKLLCHVRRSVSASSRRSHSQEDKQLWAHQDAGTLAVSRRTVQFSNGLKASGAKGRDNMRRIARVRTGCNRNTSILCTCRRWWRCQSVFAFYSRKHTYRSVRKFHRNPAGCPLRSATVEPSVHCGGPMERGRLPLTTTMPIL